MTERTRLACNWTAPILAVILAGLSLSAPALAQQPSQAQISAVKSACPADYRAHCASVPPGGQASLACLQKNLASLSPACQSAVSAIGGAPPAAQPGAAQPAPSAAAPSAAAPASAGSAAPEMPAPHFPPMSPRQEIAILRYSCGPDYRALCGGVQPGGGRAIACLRENAAQLSPRCRAVLMRAAGR